MKKIGGRCASARSYKEYVRGLPQDAQIHEIVI